MTDLTPEQVEFLQGQLKSQLEFVDLLKKLNQNDTETQENLSRLETDIQLLQTKLNLEKL